MPFREIVVRRRRLRELIAYRKDHNLSQLEAADKLGISQVTWYYIENGLRTPSVAMAKRISKLTKIPAARILGVDRNSPAA